MAPGPGRNRFGSSALIRSSIACPRGASASGSKVGAQAGGDPQLLLDQVDAVDTASVTGCSTCSRVFISRKKNSRVAGSSRHSTVPALR